jgi:two-component system, OmpR family, alkaline phosphatase synthesis response regulator PhoP
MAAIAQHSRNILVVDDEPYIGRIIQLKLEETPYTVDVCQDGATALHRLRTEARVDLILLDIMMPQMNGFEVLALLREIPHRRETPVIMLTGKGQSTDRERAESLGARDFLTKPFSPKKLLARIDEIFDAPAAAAGEPDPGETASD